MTDFWVLIGPDYCGKSTVLSELANREGRVLPVSYDRALLTEEYGPLAGLPEMLGRAAGRQTSPEFVMALLNVAVAYFHDRIHHAPPGRTLLLDSYYYKILAKCRLLGLPTEPWRTHWEALPRPTGVVFLDVPHHTAWLRSGSGAQLNRMEHYGHTPDRPAFDRFQQDLRTALHELTGPLTVEEIVPGQTVTGTADHILRVMKE